MRGLKRPHGAARHMARQLGQRIFATAFSFCFVRNPWDWTVSGWKHVTQNQDAYGGAGPDFATFVTGNWRAGLTRNPNRLKFATPELFVAFHAKITQWEHVGIGRLRPRPAPLAFYGRFERLEEDWGRILRPDRTRHPADPRQQVVDLPLHRLLRRSPARHRRRAQRAADRAVRIQVRRMTGPAGVAVLMAVRDVAAHLPATIESLRAQTDAGVAVEMVVVDDASADATPALLAAWQRQDPRVRVITAAAPLGLAGALNLGLGHVTAPLVARADGDDLYAPDRLLRQTRAMRADPRLDAISCGYVRIDENDAEIGRVVAVTGPERIRFRTLYTELAAASRRDDPHRGAAPGGRIRPGLLDRPGQRSLGAAAAGRRPSRQPAGAPGPLQGAWRVGQRPPRRGGTGDEPEGARTGPERLSRRPAAWP